MKQITDRNTLDRLVAGAVDDILNASSEEIVAEVRNSYGDEDKFVADVDEVFHEAVKQVDAQRRAVADIDLPYSSEPNQYRPTNAGRMSVARVERPTSRRPLARRSSNRSGRIISTRMSRSRIILVAALGGAVALFVGFYFVEKLLPPAAPSAIVSENEPAVPRATVSENEPATPSENEPAVPKATVSENEPAVPKATVSENEPAVPKATVSEKEPAAPMAENEHLSIPRLGYPQRSVKVIVPYPAGGTADLMPRMVADWLSRKWGQAVVIENKAGAGGNIGAEAVFRAEPDGYTLLATTPATLAINQSLYPRLGFDPAAFVPISVMGIVPNALVVNPRVPANTVAELIAYARANPGKVTAAIQVNGSTSHLTSAMFQMMAKVKLVHVPYRGVAPALQGLVAGDFDIMFDNLGVSLPLVRGRQLKLLGVGTEKRIAALPDVPTIAETLPGFASAAWFAMVAPPKTPRDIVAQISADVAEAIATADIRKRFADLSAEPVGNSPEAARRFIAGEAAVWGDVIKAGGVLPVE
jgi:tripartite-type tricarboxylate transporter receptor subunit TctC